MERKRRQEADADDGYGRRGPKARKCNDDQQRQHAAPRAPQRASNQKADKQPTEVDKLLGWRQGEIDVTELERILQRKYYNPEKGRKALDFLTKTGRNSLGDTLAHGGDKRAAPAVIDDWKKSGANIMYSVFEQEMCLSNPALEIAYYRNNIDRLVSKPPPGNAGERTHFRGSAMESILESVYEDDFEAWKVTDMATEAMRGVMQTLDIYPKRNTIPFTTLKPGDAARFANNRNAPLSASTQFRQLYSQGRHNINKLPYAVDDTPAVEPETDITKARASLPEPRKSPKTSQDSSFTSAPITTEEEDTSVSEGLQHLPSPPLFSADDTSLPPGINWPSSPTTDQGNEEAGFPESSLSSLTDSSTLRWSLSSIWTAENMVPMPYRRRARSC